jgi:CRP-like cAMP-binding protein
VVTISQADLAELMVLSHARRFAAGEAIFRQGDEADGMYLIEVGRVRVSMRLPGDSDLDVAISDAGAVLGEVAMLDGGKRSATAVALEPVIAHFFGFRMLHALRLDRRPVALRLVRKIAAVVGKRIRESVSALGDQITRPPQNKSNTLVGPLPSRVPWGARRSPAAAMDPVLMRVIPLFEAMSADDRTLLLSKSTLLEAERGVVLSREGERADNLRLVVRGAVQMRVERGDFYHRLFLIGPGHVSGAVEFIDGGRRAWTSAAREQFVGLEIPTTEVEGMVSTGSTLGLALLDAAIEELMSAHRRIAREKARFALEGTIDLIGPGTIAKRGL